MLDKLLKRFRRSIPTPKTTSRSFAISPYPTPEANFIYNLLFCDDRSLFRNDQNPDLQEPWATILAEEPDIKSLEAIASDEKNDSRTRVLAHNRLRQSAVEVPARRTFGIIVEVPLEHGLDTLAAFADGGVRYINYTGKMSLFEGGDNPLASNARELVAAAQAVVEKIGPWGKDRLPPPPRGHIRLSFLVSDGLYFGEGPYQALKADPLGGNVLARTEELLLLVVSTSTAS